MQNHPTECKQTSLFSSPSASRSVRSAVPVIFCRQLQVGLQMQICAWSQRIGEVGPAKDRGRGCSGLQLVDQWDIYIYTVYKYIYLNFIRMRPAAGITLVVRQCDLLAAETLPQTLDISRH